MHGQFTLDKCERAHGRVCAHPLYMRPLDSLFRTADLSSFHVSKVTMCGEDNEGRIGLFGVTDVGSAWFWLSATVQVSV